MDLFEYAKSKTLDQESPLASRLRPTTLDEVVGQQHIIGKNTLLYRAIKADKLTSVIFYGPSRNRQDHPGKSNRQHYQCRIHPDQRHCSRQKRYGSSCKRSPAKPGYVRQKNNPLHRRDPPLQQRPAGLSPPIRRRRNHHPHRCHNRESILRSQRCFNLPFHHLRTEIPGDLRSQRTHPSRSQRQNKRNGKL